MVAVPAYCKSASTANRRLFFSPLRATLKAMSGPEDKKSPPGAPPAKPETDKSSGRVAFDSRGNPTWEWQTSTGVFGRDVSTQRLKKLEAEGLAIVETPPADAKKPAAKKGFELSLDEPGKGSKATGFNPYDNSSAVAPKKVADAPRKPVSDLRKLDQWIKLKKGLKDNDKK